jgi:DNA topoisomerase-1
MTREPEELKSAARLAHLRHVTDLDPGIERRRAGGGFYYRDPAGDRIEDSEVIERIRALAIPPAWNDVWICRHANGHIQAVGRDARGRKQYLYHPKWRQVRDTAKYERVTAFGRRLPKLREAVDRDLRRRGLNRRRVIAAVVRLLELTVIRVGNEDYARKNRSFGLTTLRKRHAILGATGAVFEFRGKGGAKYKTGFRDARIARVAHACSDLPGQRLFQYVDDEGVRHSIESADVNGYIREAMGEDFSAKDFRTWAGSLAACEFLAATGGEPEKSAVNACVKAVAKRLGNTPAVCRASYIHPEVLRAYLEGKLSRARQGADPEQRLLRLLSQAD